MSYGFYLPSPLPPPNLVSRAVSKILLCPQQHVCISHLIPQGTLYPLQDIRLPKGAPSINPTPHRLDICLVFLYLALHSLRAERKRFDIFVN